MADRSAMLVQPKGSDSDAGAGGGGKLSTSIMQRVFQCDLELNPFMCAYIGLCHLLALHALIVLVWPHAHEGALLVFDARVNDALGLRTPAVAWAAGPPVKPATLWLAFWLWPVSGLGITAGAHRLWSHRSYDANPVLRMFLMLCNSMANQGSIFHWARDHRTHHLHSDTASDPHDSNRGWFYSHMGWLLVRKPEAVVSAGKQVDLSDLREDAMVMLQKRWDPWWNMFWCFCLPSVAARCFWGETWWNGFLFAGMLRYVWVLHCTWSVNSIVHTYGSSPYAPEDPPCESGLVALLAIGEGWHSWHHAFAFDYATAELGCLQQWNPTKVFIDAMALIGLASGRKRGTGQWMARKQLWEKRLAGSGKCLREGLRGPPLFRVRTIEEVPIDSQQDDQAASPSSSTTPSSARSRCRRALGGMA